MVLVLSFRKSATPGKGVLGDREGDPGVWRELHFRKAQAIGDGGLAGIKGVRFGLGNLESIFFLGFLVSLAFLVFLVVGRVRLEAVGFRACSRVGVYERGTSGPIHYHAAVGKLARRPGAELAPHCRWRRQDRRRGLRRKLSGPH